MSAISLQRSTLPRTTKTSTTGRYNVEPGRDGDTSQCEFQHTKKLKKRQGQFGPGGDIYRRAKAFLRGRESA